MRKVLNWSSYLLRAVPLLGALLSPHITIGNSGYHSLFLKNNGSLHAMGSNAWGEFGNGSTSSSAQTSPVQIQPSGVTQFASGHRHVVIVKSDGSAYAMGQNTSGALGNANNVDQTSPAQIFPSGVKSVAAGAFFTLLLKNDGSLHVTGSNGNGQLGTGDTSNRNSPFQIISSGVTGIAGGTNHSLLLKSDGSVFATGQNNYGQLGTGGTNNFISPTQIFSSGVIQVASGANHSLFLKTDGSLWATGRNQRGQLGTGDTVDRNSSTQIVSSGVIQVASGSEHSVFLKSDGSLHVMGSNVNGQLGTGDNLDRNSSVQILSSGVVQIAAGASHTLFLKADGSLWTFGWNSNGQLGVDDTVNRSAPTMVFPSGVTRLSEVTDDFRHFPTDLNSTAPLAFSENQPIGTVVGEFNATDPDANATLQYSLVDGNESNDNHLFTLDNSGSLRSAVIFDYENNASSYSIRVQVRDEFNASTESTFTILLEDLFEDAKGEQSLVFWSSQVGGSTSAAGIHRVNFDGTGKVTLFDFWAYIAADSNYLYYTSGELGSIYRARHDGSSPEVLISGYHGLLKVEDNYLYWLDKSGGTGLYRANLDGSGVELYLSELAGGTEFWGNSQYWFVNNDNQSIKRFDRDGGNGINIHPEGYPVASGAISADEDWVYWSKWSGDVYRAKHDGSSASMINLSSFVDSMFAYESYLFLGNRGTGYNPVTYTLRNGTNGVHLYNGLDSKYINSLAVIYNQAPTDLNSTAPLTIAENQPVGSFVGEFNATDPDVGASLTYHLVSGAGDTHNSLFTLETNGTLKTATTFDYESNASSYSIRVQVKDEFNASVEGNFTVTLIEQNEPPAFTNLMASASPVVQVQENLTSVTTLTGTDPEGQFTEFVLTGPDAHLFEVNQTSGNLSFVTPPDFENPSDHDFNNSYELGVLIKESNYSAESTFLAFENFDYPLGDVLGRNGGIGWNGPWQGSQSWNVIDGNVIVNGVFATGGQLLMGNQHVKTARDFQKPITIGDQVGEYPNVWIMVAIHFKQMLVGHSIDFRLKGSLQESWIVIGKKSNGNISLSYNNPVSGISAISGPKQFALNLRYDYDGNTSMKLYAIGDNTMNQMQTFNPDDMKSFASKVMPGKTNLEQIELYRHNNTQSTLDEIAVIAGELADDNDGDGVSNWEEYLQKRIQLHTEKTLRIEITNQNDTPTDLNSTAPLAFAENQPIGTV
ncbi:MAG: DUF5050 domain-containing protein, partial [Opitutae bacterium]|nr:DUF5050 domain-containing protein [Opitutae bacterium]